MICVMPNRDGIELGFVRAENFLCVCSFAFLRVRSGYNCRVMLSLEGKHVMLHGPGIYLQATYVELHATVFASSSWSLSRSKSRIYYISSTLSCGAS